MAECARLSLSQRFAVRDRRDSRNSRAPRYTGVRTFNEFDRKGDGERKAQSEIVEYEIPVIIDQSTFESVQALLE
ncbi:recombinase family protein [Frankia sp. RB7]|nr:recombinase family protein [Frankia sp. RB7]